MPIFNFSWFGGKGHQSQPPGPQPNTPQPIPALLVDIGPVLQVQVEVPTPLAAALQKAGQALPPPATGLALIDTGATRSAVDDTVVKALGVQPIGVVKVGTAGGMVNQCLYSAKFSFPGSNLPSMEFAQLTGVNLQGHVVPHLNIPLVALIGRDILSQFVMTYNGPGASLILAF